MCCPHCADLRRRIEVLEALLPSVSALTADERAFVAQLLAVIAAEFGSREFIMSELTQRPSVRLVIGSRSATGLGQLFARAAGEIIDGFEIEKLGRQGSRTLWKVWRRDR